MFPVSIPLIFAVAMSGVIVNQPDGNLAFWMSIILRLLNISKLQLLKLKLISKINDKNLIVFMCMLLLGS